MLSINNMKCLFCGKCVGSSSYCNHKNNTNCVYHRRGIYYCKCEKYATDKYHDFLTHAKFCTDYTYREDALNRFDLSFEEKYRIESAKVVLYEKLIQDIFHFDISKLDINSAIKKYKIQEYNEKFITESEKSEQERKERSEKKSEKEADVKEEKKDSHTQLIENIYKCLTEIEEGNIKIYPDILYADKDTVMESLLLVSPTDVALFIFSVNYNLEFDITFEILEELKEYQNKIETKNIDDILVYLIRGCFFFTDMKILKNLDTPSSELSDIIVSNLDFDTLLYKFKKCYIKMFEKYEYTEKALKSPLKSFMENMIILYDRDLLEKYLDGKEVNIQDFSKLFAFT